MPTFIDNKYTKLYYQIINHAVEHNSSLSEQDVENHHIIPECFFINSTRGSKIGWLLGDPEAPDNKVRLTLRQHLLCHYLLTKMTLGRVRCSMLFSYNMMSNFSKYNTRIYSKTKKEANQFRSTHMTIQMTGRKHSSETLEKKRIAMLNLAAEKKQNILSGRLKSSYKNIEVELLIHEIESTKHYRGFWLHIRQKYGVTHKQLVNLRRNLHDYKEILLGS